MKNDAILQIIIAIWMQFWPCDAIQFAVSEQMDNGRYVAGWSK